MKILSYIFLGVMLIGFSVMFITLLSTTRKIRVEPRKTENNFVVTPYRDYITPKAKSINEFLFLNNGGVSLMTALSGLLIFVFTTLLLFGPDQTRIKIYNAHFIEYLMVLYVCSAIFSWYFTASFLNTLGNGLALYKQRFDFFQTIFWPLYIVLWCLPVVRKFKQNLDDYNLQTT